MKFFNKLGAYNQINNIFWIYLLLSYVCCVMAIGRLISTGEGSFLFLIWNLFLAWIPFIMALIINYIYSFYKSGRVKNLMLLGCGAIWLFFYPNAPYLITDYIHLSRISFFSFMGSYNMNFTVWYDFVMFSLFIFTGFLLGFVSLYMVQKLVAVRFNKVAGWLMVTGTLFLSSFGIYLGRFIRWNTWDIITNPVSLIKSVLESLNRHSGAFTITFGVFLVLIYVALYYITRLSRYEVVFDI
ncbi:DUF1361 domain-containing protein [Clostridium thermarum]|uniref:DUF1361 domain-containing protein n=1 Tax=Clostridium thermarum TaxID=1716543 RepID=UPI0013D030B0|nr:DUF1361 domain-containing protein [Clostridium thermarum]